MDRRSILKSAAALALATEISMQPVEPVMRNGPSPASPYARAMRAMVCVPARAAKRANGSRIASATMVLRNPF